LPLKPQSVAHPPEPRRAVFASLDWTAGQTVSHSNICSSNIGYWKWELPADCIYGRLAECAARAWQWAGCFSGMKIFQEIAARIVAQAVLRQQCRKTSDGKTGEGGVFRDAVFRLCESGV